MFLWFLLVIMSFFSSRGWESWDIANRPLIPERMPVLVDDDLLFEDGQGAPRPSVAVNQWLRELPSSGAPSPKSWEYYARAVREWMEFLAAHGVGTFDSRDRLKQALGKYAEHRAAGPVAERFAATTWAQHMSILSLFYRWAIDEGHASAEPFTYRTARALFNGTGREVKVNLAVRRTPKPHVTVKYLEADFAELFLDGLRGLGPDDSYRGRELARNAAVGELALATGLRLQEFSYLLSYEVPPLPSRPADAPIPFPVPAGVTKGRKFRTTWISYDALAAVRQYVKLDRVAAADGSSWRPPQGWGELLLVTEPDARGGRINGIRRKWDSLTPGERRRLVAPGGGSCLIAVRGDGGPFTAWPTVFERTADRIRRTCEPRFPHVNPHRLRHFRNSHPRAAGERPLPAGRPARRRHRPRCRPGVLPVQGRPADGAPRPPRPLLSADHRKIPAKTGHNAHLPGGIRACRGGRRAPGRCRCRARGRRGVRRSRDGG